MFGDYEYFCVMYGLTGANGKHPCLFRTMNLSDMQLPKGTVGVQHEPRTLEHFKENFHKFETDYGMGLKHAKQCYNVIDVLFFDIPLNQACLPGLQMTLGIFMKIFRDIIERFCETMDTVILEHQISQQGTPGYYDNFIDYIELIKQRKSLSNNVDYLETRLSEIQEEIDWFTIANENFDATQEEIDWSTIANENFDATQEEIDWFTIANENFDATQEEIDWFTIANENFDATQHLEEIECIQGEIDEEEARMVEIDKDVKEEHVTGPCTKSLDPILKEICVERQAYYGNTIYGNHCHLLLKENNIVKLCGTIPNEILCEIGEGVEYRNSFVETDKMPAALRLYANCHSIFNSAKHLEDNIITVSEHHVAEFMLYFRSNWPSINISPRLHLLEYLTAHFLRLWGTGCGFYGEQGAESAHNGINRMKHRYANVKNDLSRLEYIMNLHLLSTNPKAQATKPAKRTRKSRNSVDLP